MRLSSTIVASVMTAALFVAIMISAASLGMISAVAPEPIVVTVEVTPPPDPRYIEVDVLGLTFTMEAYHERVRASIEEHGYMTICVLHLGTLAHEARYLNVNNARQNLVYVTECDAESVRMELPDKQQQSTEETPTP